MGFSPCTILICYFFHITNTSTQKMQSFFFFSPYWFGSLYWSLLEMIFILSGVDTTFSCFSFPIISSIAYFIWVDFFLQFTCCIPFKLRSSYPKIYRLDFYINFTSGKFFEKFYVTVILIKISIGWYFFFFLSFLLSKEAGI